MVPQVLSVSLQHWKMMKPSKIVKEAIKSTHTRNNLTRMHVITADILIAKDHQLLAIARTTTMPRFTTIVRIIIFQEGTEH